MWYKSKNNTNYVNWHEKCNVVIHKNEIERQALIIN